MLGIFRGISLELLVGHVVYLPQPEHAVLGSGWEESESLHLHCEVLCAVAAAEEVVDVANHGAGNSAGAY